MTPKKQNNDIKNKTMRPYTIIISAWGQREAGRVTDVTCVTCFVLTRLLNWSDWFVVSQATLEHSGMFMFHWWIKLEQSSRTGLTSSLPSHRKCCNTLAFLILPDKETRRHTHISLSLSRCKPYFYVYFFNTTKCGGLNLAT